jgi:DNA-directed RNA polymerase subunit RPC12/RpoP
MKKNTIDNNQREIICPVCEHDLVETRSRVIDKKTGKRVTHWLWGWLRLLVGVSILALGIWLFVGVLTTPLPSYSNVSCITMLLPGLIGGIMVWESVKALVRWKKADKVEAHQYKCGVCKHEWTDFGESAESLPKKLSSNCFKCGKSFTGILYDWKTLYERKDHRNSNMVGYRCKSCGSDFCAKCKEEHIKFNWVTGLEKSPCPKCNNPFGPGFYFYKYKASRDAQ